MPNVRPPPDYRGTPVRCTLSAGTKLSRVHNSDWSVTDFNSTVADRHWGGGRFDGTNDDPYAYLYAGSSDAVAFSETILRDVPFDDTGARFLPRATLASRQIGWLHPLVDLDLVSLRSGADLAAVAQDMWLVHAPSSEYGSTRRWAHQIRGWAPWAAGFVWHSRREPNGSAYVFFRDRCPDNPFEVSTANAPLPPSDLRLDVGGGAIYARELLEQYRVTVAL